MIALLEAKAAGLWSRKQVATLMAGIILVAFGAARLGAVIKYIPSPVIVGFTAGIGVIIFVGQWKDFFGLSPAPSGLHFHEKFVVLVQAFPTISVATTGLALLALAILLVGPRFMKRIPAPLVAMVVITVVQSIFHFEGVATIGSAFGGIPRTLPSFAIPSVHLAQIISLVGPAFTIALLGSIECEVRPNVLHKLERAGVIRHLGAENISATLALALSRATAIDLVKEALTRTGKRLTSPSHE
jgi:MFS superfamily sulfate permease-like transporter